MHKWVVVGHRGAEEGGETGSLLSRGPNVRLDPRIMGSRSKPKADAQQLSHLGAPKNYFLNKNAFMNMNYLIYQIPHI